MERATRRTVLRRLRKLALALIACLIFAVVAPMYFAERRIDDSFAIATVSAAPRDLHLLTVPVRLSNAPDLTLVRAVIYDYGPTIPGGPPAAPGGPVSQVVLDGPVFALDASGRRAAAGSGGSDPAQAGPKSPGPSPAEQGPSAPPEPPAGPPADAAASASAQSATGVTGAPEAEALGKATAAPPGPEAAAVGAPSAQTMPGAAEEPAEPMVPLLKQIAGLGFELITIRRGTLSVTMADGSVETLTDLQAEIRKGAKGEISSLGSFTVRGQRLAFDATLVQPPDKKLPDRWPLQVSFKAGLLQGSFEGHADLGEDLELSGQTELSTSSLRGIGRWFGLPLYLTDGFNATTVKGDLTWAHRSLAFEKAQISVDGNAGNGRLALNLATDRPRIEATLDFASLDLRPYIEATRTQFFGFELPGSPWSSFDLSLPMIRYLDADMRISAHRVMLKDNAIGQGAATISAQAGKLHADITELDLPWGSASAQVTAIMSEVAPRYALRAEVENLETGPATAMLLRSAALSGHGTFSVDLTSTGYSLTEVARHLSGKAALSMPEGGRVALDLKAAYTAARSGVHGWAPLAKSSTSLDRLEARVLVIDGVAFADEVEAQAGNIGLALTGRLGVVDGNMDARLTLKPKAAPTQPSKPAEAVPETLIMRGPWSRPDVRGEDADAGASWLP